MLSKEIGMEYLICILFDMLLNLPVYSYGHIIRPSPIHFMGLLPNTGLCRHLKPLFMGRFGLSVSPVRPFQIFSMFSVHGQVGFGLTFRKKNKKKINKKKKK